MSNILLETIIFLFFVFFGAFLAAAEIALSSIGENKIEELKQKKSRVVSYFELIQEDPESIFGSIQLLYTVSRILTAIIGFPVAIYFINYLLNLIDPGVVTNTYSVLAVILAVIAIAFLIIVFCLLIPKAIGFKYANGLAVISIKPLYWISRLFRILVKILTAISNFLLKPIKEKTNFSQTRPSEDEILEIISDGVKSGAIDETEQEIIENVLEFNDLKAHEVMIPRIEMVAIDLTDENETRLNEVIKTGHSLIPAYEETPDNIMGVIHTKDLMKQFVEKKKISLKNLLRPAFFIPDTKPISQVLKEMQQIGERLAIVTDEYGGTEGIITLEDILEEIVGEIKDRTKVEISDFTKFPDGSYCILGSMDIDDFNETFSYKLQESEEYNTVAGFIADKTGKIMNQGDSFETDGVHFELIKKIKQKMVQFRVYSNEQEFVVVEKEKKEENGSK